MSLALEKPLLKPNLDHEFLNEKVIYMMTVFARNLRVYGFHVNVTSPSAIAKLEYLTSTKKIEIIRYYETLCQWTDPTSVTPDIHQDPLSLDKTFLRRALDYYGLDIDNEFIKTLTPDTLVEIYGHDMVQLYRSLSFFNISGYSLLDLSVHEWYVLWERPRMAVEKIMSYAKDVLTTVSPVQKVVIPKHILRETYNTGQTEPFVPRAIMVEMLNVGSLTYKNSFSKTPGGLICTSKGQVIAMGAEASNIEFV